MTASAPPPAAAPRGRRARPRAREDVATVVDHLTELRTRVLVTVGFLLVAFAGCYWQKDRIFRLLDRPLDGRYPVQTLGVTEPFFTSLSIAAQAAFVLVTPVIAWQAWRFVRPAVAPEARRTIGVLLLVAPVLFCGGVVFGYVLVLGPAIQFLLGIGPDSFDVVVRARDYYSFVSTTLLAVGAIFLFPLLLLGLARIGIVTSTLLRSQRRVAYVLMVILAALLPTVDPVSLLIELLPLVVLYELSVIAVRIQERRLGRREAGEA